MMKSHTDWKMEELLNQEQRNFSGHLAIIFCYLQEKGLSVDDFVEYTGAKVSARWKSAATNLQDTLNAILFNVLSNGEKILSVKIDENDAVATVTGLFKSDVMQYYGCIPEIYDRFWNKFKLIAGDAGFSFSWEKTEEGYYQIRLRTMDSKK
jgi:hypothetical protein